MSYIQPDSEIWLCSGVPLDPSYDNQLTFTSGTGASRIWDSNKQKAYFASKAVSHPQNYSIVKERDGVLRLAGDVGDFYNINYMFFTNSNFSNKLFYAFVTKVEYLNPNTTLMYFELDEFQTWAENLEFKESSIEREHVEHDEMYANLEDEGMPISERIPYAVEYFDACLGEKQLVIGATEKKDNVESIIKTGGFEIPYDYLNFAPNLDHTDTNYYEVNKISNLECFTSTGDNVKYSSFYFDSTLKNIIIKGLDDLTITRIEFMVDLTYKFVYQNYTQSVNNLAMAIRGTKSNDVWSFELNGTVIPYSSFYDYPNIRAKILTYGPKRVKLGHTSFQTYLHPIISTSMYKDNTLPEEIVRKTNYFQIKGMSPITGIQFNLWNTQPFTQHTDGYNIEGLYTNNAWEFHSMFSVQEE